MRGKLTKIVAVSVALVMLVSCVALGIGHSTNNVSFDDSLPTGNLTAFHYHRMPINDVGHFDSHLEHIQRYDNGFREENGCYFDSRHGYPGSDRSLSKVEEILLDKPVKKAVTENASQQISETVEQTDSRSVVSLSSNTTYVPEDYAKIQWAVDNGTNSWVMCNEPKSIGDSITDSVNATKSNASQNNTFSYASGKTWYVDDDGGPGIDFTKIQDAVNAATAGDTIIVKDGTYNEQVKLTKQLTIEGENRPVINAAGKPQNYGVFIDHTSGCVIRGLEIKPSTEVEVGIYLYYSHSNQIIDNIASNHRYGVAVVYSNDNVVNANVVYDNLGGIGVWYSTGNNIRDNIAYDNYDRSGGDSGNIGINYANNNDLINNTVSTAQNAVGIGLWDSDNCILTDNTARNNRNGIYISGSSNTSLNTNIMENNTYNFGVLGAALSDFIHTIDTSNTINGKPIYYLVNAVDQTVDATSNAGYVGVVNSSNIVVENLNLSNNTDGVLFAFTDNSEIKNLNISNNLNGICLISSYSNHIYHNVITGNEQNAYDNVGTNLWDDGYPSGGNYWGDYGGVDFYQGPNQNITGRDRIGDTPYYIPGGTGAKDNYPLMLASAQWSFPTQLTYNTAMDLWPSISGDGSKIAFQSNVDGDFELFVIDSDGTGLTQLTHNAGVQSQSISGDGSKIAFESYVSGDSEAFLFVINSDGTGLTQLTHNDCQLRQSISGDGNKIAFESYIDGDYEIFVINSNGTGLTQVTSNTTSNNRYPSITGDGSKIAFFSDVDGDSEIFVINSDGTGLIQLTHNAAFDVCPSISGDGSKVAFQSVVDAEHYYEIFVVNSDGTGLTQLTYNAATDWCPSITGDGSKIAFQSAVDGDSEIFVIDSDGTGLTQLTHNAASDWWPSISSDGNKVAFHSDVDGDREIFVVSYTPSIPPTCAIDLQKNGNPIDNINVGEFFDIYVGGSTDDQSIKEVRFSSDDAQDGNPTGEWTDWYDWDTSSGDWNAVNKIKAWAFATGGDKEVWAEVKDGDGQRDKDSANIYANPLQGKIAFASSRGGNQEVYVINADSSGHPINLTNFPDADDGDPTWSPDGKQIAFSSNRSGNWKTYVMDADDGSNQVCLLEAVYDAWGPAWSPDGKEIAFACQLSSNDDFEIYTMDIQSKALTQVTDNSDDDSHPAWSPDSHKIVFTSTRDGNHELYVADLLAGTQTRLTDEPAYDDYPEWSPDGSMIVFVSDRDGNLEIYSMNITSKAITRLTYNECTDKHAQWSPDGQKIIFVSDRDGGGDLDVYVMNADGTSIACLVEWEGDETHPTWSPSSAPAPTADAGGPYNGNVDEDIQFHGSATGGTPPYTYVWEFFNRDTSETVIGPNPTHTWSTKGLYFAQLRVQDSAGVWSKGKVCMVFVFISDPLLEKYAPVLYFHKDEKFYPTKINALLDHSELKDPYGNVIVYEPVTVDDLMLFDDEDSYLDMTLIGGIKILRKLAPDLKHFENYPSNIYARKEVVGADIVLQYWFFYPYNQGTFNAHEGDWEMIQVLLDCNENPYRVTYSWHVPFLKLIFGGKTYDWSDVKKVSNTHPKVYVNKGSHANNKQAFTQTILPFEIGKIIHPKGVYVDGSNKEELDYLTIIDELELEDQMRWINWKGKWGEQVITGFSGVVGPKYASVEYWAEIVYLWKTPLLWSIVCSDGYYKLIRHSPVNIHIYDQYNNHAVITENGIFESEISGVYYFEPEQALYLANASNEYRIFVEATDEGEFGLDIVRKSGNETTLIQYQNISITQNTTANMSINQTTTNYTMEIDTDGDGVVNEVKFPDSIETDYAPAATISLPVNDSVHLYGTEIAFNGTGTDLEDGILTNSSLVWSSSIDGCIDIGNTFTNANLSAGTHLIELMVNDSSGQIGMENVTLTVIAPELVIDASNISFSNHYPVEGENITINATIHNVGTANAASITVQFFDGIPLNGTQIGANQTIAMINTGENKNVAVAWNTSGEAGDNSIWVAVDPADSIKEPDEENNQANKSIFVGAPHVLHILHAQTDSTVYLGYEAVLINCIVENASGNISANVSADIEKSDGIIDNITLMEGLIGIYNGAFTNTSLSGIYSITIYANRTGFIGDTESLSFEVLDTTPPAGIANLTHTIGATWINWTWDKPPNPDFEYTLIYLNGTWKTITAKGYYLAEGLDVSTGYEIGTRTVDAEGNMNTIGVNQTARTSENHPPIANFTYTPENPGVNQTVTFNASSSYDPDGNITNYEWKFDDGNITNTTEEMILHSYALAGNYNVSLTVTDNEGATNTRVLGIAVSSMPDLVVTENWVCWAQSKKSVIF